jgi:Family of unknown function (DUF6152)
MAKYSRSAWFLGAVLLLAAVPVFAHHGAASVYDPGKKFNFTGTVTKVLWQNPHIGIFFDAKDPDTGKMENWELGDGQAPTGLYRKGWRKDDIKVGETITVTGANRAWNGDFRLGGGVITNAAGEKLFAGTKGDGAGSGSDSAGY